MEYFAGLDVSVKTTAICVVDSTGSAVLETSVATEPEAIRCALEGYADRLRRVGHEAGALSPWLHRGLERLGLKIVLLETRHVHAALEAQRNKTDKNDALGVAQLVRSGWYRDVHVKSETSYRRRLLLTHRPALKLKAWGMKLQRHRGHQRAVVPLARKLAMILHAMWRDGSEFRSGKRIVRCGKLAAIRDGSDRQTANEHPSYRRFVDELDANFMLRSTDSRAKSRLELRPIAAADSTKIAGRPMLEAHDFCVSTTPIPQSAALDSTRRWHATSAESGGRCSAGRLMPNCVDRVWRTTA